VEDGFEKPLQIRLSLCFCAQDKFFAALTAVVRVDAILGSAPLANVYFIHRNGIKQVEDHIGN
jgi:hypothetical protein